MSLTSHPHPTGRPAHSSPCDPEALLLEAIHQRQARACLDRIQRSVHRRGLHWLDGFLAQTLPSAAGAEALAWLNEVLADEAQNRGHGAVAPQTASVTSGKAHHPTDLPMPTGSSSDLEDRTWMEHRAAAAVDGAIASMLAEFPELAPPSPSLGLTLPPPVMPIPADPLVPDVLPGRQPAPIFYLAAPFPLEPAAALSSPLESQIDAGVDAIGSVGVEPAHSEGSSDGHHDPDPLEAIEDEPDAPWQRSAAERSVAFGSRLFRRFSPTDWRSLTRRVRERAVSLSAAKSPVQEGEGLDSTLRQPSEEASFSPFSPAAESSTVSEAVGACRNDLVGVESADAASWLEPQPGSDGGDDQATPDPLVQVVRLVERQGHRGRQREAAPAPAALADLRAWLPDAA